MGYSPKIGREAEADSLAARIENMPSAEVLGEIKVKGRGVTAWEDPETKTLIEMEEGPPPWELTGALSNSDARNFLDCPADWVLYWINPKLLDAYGWRGWQHVRAADKRVKVKVRSMISVEGMIRRGGQGGDILAYMPRHWYESRKKQQAEVTRVQTDASVSKLENLKDDFRRGVYGPNIHLDSATHPTHTMADLPRGLAD